MNPANNHIVGQSYDANGNTLYATNAGTTYTLLYDPREQAEQCLFRRAIFEYFPYNEQTSTHLDLARHPGPLREHGQLYGELLLRRRGQKLRSLTR